jgi:hypothetical protein
MSLSNAMTLGSGAFVRTIQQIEQDHRAAEFRSRSMTYRKIGETLGVSTKTAYCMVQRAIEDVPKEATKDLIALELEKLDRLDRKYLEIMDKPHPYVSASGRVVIHNGEILIDDRPTMEAIAGLVRVADRRARLLGLNAPTRADITSIASLTVESKSEQCRAEVMSLLQRLSPKAEATS